MSFAQTNNIYTYTTIFNINSEKSLDDLCSYFIFRLNLEKSAYTYDRFARLYNFLNDSKKLLSPSLYITISLQETNEQFLLSIDTTITNIIDEFITRLKRLDFPYQHKNNILRYAIDKRDPNETPAVRNLKPVKYAAYDFISQTDLDEMSDCIKKMQDRNYEKVCKTLLIDEINAYRTTLSYYSSFLKFYPQLNTMNSVVTELAVLLSLYSDDCLRLGTDFRRLLQSFSKIIPRPLSFKISLKSISLKRK